MAKKDYAAIARTVADLVGGPQNVKSLQHCSTRLRFKLVDAGKMDADGLNAVQGVAGVNVVADGVQVIIGTDVEDVYNELAKLGVSLGGEVADDAADALAEQDTNAKKQNPVMRVMTTIADCMVPAIPALIAAGLMNAIVTICTTLGILSDTSQTYQILDLMAEAPIYFLPFMVAVGASKRFKCNTFLAIASTAVLLYPTFTSIAGEGAEYASFFGLPIVRLVDYSSQLLPIILLCLFLSYVERFVHKIMPRAISTFAEPLLTYIIVTVVTLIALGPLGAYVGDLVTAAVGWMAGRYNWLFGLLFAGFGNFLIASGMHYGLIPIVIANFTANGYDSFYASACFAGAFALSGAVLAIAVKSKRTDVKGIASSTGFTALLGISEPALYGVFFRYKACMVGTVVAGCIGGCLGGIIGVNSYGMSPAGLTSIPVLMGPTFVNALIVIVLSFVIGFGVSFVMYHDEEEGAADVSEQPAPIEAA